MKITIKQTRVRVNELIRAKEIRVIDESAGQLGIMTPEQALAIARSRDMDSTPTLRFAGL